MDFNHHEAGAWLGHKWKLPYEIIDIIEHHHKLDYQQRNSNLVQLIGLCSRISRQWILETNYDPMQELDVIKSLNLKPDELKKYLDKSSGKLADIQQLVDDISK